MRESGDAGGRLIDIAADPRGGIAAIFGLFNRGVNDLYLQRLELGAKAWSEPNLVGSGDFGFLPTSAIAADGTMFVVFNNAMWEEVERAALAVFPKGQASRRNRVPVAPLGDHPAYEHMMEVYGGYGERVEKPADLPGALARALKEVKKNRQALLNVIVSRRGAPP